MNDKIFVDSNIWLYLLGNDQTKKKIALGLLQQNLFISTQVLSENANVCIRKFKLDIPTTQQHIQNLINYCQVLPIHSSTIFDALSIAYCR